MRIRILVAAAMLAAVAGCAAPGGNTIPGSALPATGSAAAAGGDAATSSPNTSAPNTSAPNTSSPNTSSPNTSSPNTSSPNTSSPNTSSRATSSAGASVVPPPERPPSSTASGTPRPTRCHTSQLSASLAPGQPGAGQRYATLSLTNTSARTCTVFGYGGLQPLDASKKQLPITLTRDTGRPPKLITLAPGASVGRTIHWTVVPSGSQPCPTPAYASIIPPDETTALVIGWSLGPICGSTIDGWPYGVTL